MYANYCKNYRDFNGKNARVKNCSLVNRKFPTMVNKCDGIVMV